MPEPSAAHDPEDLRKAAKILKWDDREWPELAARLEAWADDMERPAPNETAALLREATHYIGRRKWMECPDLDRVAEGLEDIADRMERLAPLEAAVLDAAKALPAEVLTPDTHGPVARFKDAVRALRAATDD